MVEKIALEEHFALPETLHESEFYAADGMWPQSNPVCLMAMANGWRDGQARHRDLRAVAERAGGAGHGRHWEGHRAWRARPIISCRRHRQVSRPFGRLRGAADAGPGCRRDRANAVRWELGFVGALVNGFSQAGDAVLYYDDPRYLPFWAVVQDLDVPFYLHPRDPLPSRTRDYDGHPWFEGPAWAFGVETAMHALRLMGGGLFDRYPRLQIILGHLGEGLPYSIWRLDQRVKRRRAGFPPKGPWPNIWHPTFI